MVDLAATTVHRFLGSGDRAAERLDDRLVPQADTQDRFAGLEFCNRLQADAGLVRIAGPWREHDGGGVELLDLFDGNRVVADHVRVTTQLPEVPSEVVDEGVVVVDDQDHFLSIYGGSVFSVQCSGAGGRDVSQKFNARTQRR